MSELVSHKLDLDGRRKAEALIEAIANEPDTAAFEIVGLRDLGMRLAQAALNRGHSEACMAAMDELRDALAGLPMEERQPGDYNYRCSCELSKLLEDARNARLL